MSTAVRPRTRPIEGENRFLVHGLDWHGYETLLGLFGERAIRIAYDRGDLELMSPLITHERFRSLLGRMVETITEELEIPCVAAGSTTFRREDLDRGLEPDECYYLANAHRLRKVRQVDLTIDPPPDLAIEVEITTSALNRLGIYGALGVPEVWRYDGESLKVFLRQPDGTYALSPTSAAFPFLPMEELARFLRDYDATDDTRWGRAFRHWVREEIVPRAGGGDGK